MANSDVLKPESLTPEAQSIVKSKQVTGRKRVSEWIGLLEELARYDTLTDAEQTKARKLAIGSLVVGFLTGFGALFLFVVSQDGGGAMVPAVVAGMAAAILILAALFFFVRCNSMDSVDLSNGFRETILPLLEALAEDIAPKKRVKLSLDLGKPTSPQNTTGSETVELGPSNKVVKTTYHTAWCTLDAPLVAGNRLRLAFDDTFLSLHRHYRNPRGKYKSKRKWKTTTTVSASLVPDAAHLTWGKHSAEGATADGKTKLAEKNGVEICRLTKRFKRKSPGNPPDTKVDVDDIVALLMALCAMLTPAERSA